jgi:hypothetical protein
MDSVVVADRDSPMKNLFETGRLEVKLRPQAALRGKVYIEQLRADHLKFGTPRATSGALPRFAARIAARQAEPPAPPLVDLSKFDAMALLNAEYDKLESPKLYQAAIDTYSAARDKWENEYQAAKAQVADLQAKAKPLLAVNASSIKTPEEALQIAGQVKTMADSVEAAKTEVEHIISGVQADIATAAALTKSARDALQADIAHLKSYINLGNGEAFKAIEPFILAMLSEQALAYVNYGKRGLEAFEKLKNFNIGDNEYVNAAKSNEYVALGLEYKEKLDQVMPKKEKKPAFEGRIVTYPTPGYARFFLNEMASDFDLAGWNWGFDLRAVSSDPDISNRPTELDLNMTEQGSYGRYAEVRSSADFRTNAQQYFGVNVAGGNFPVDVGGALKKAGIGGFKSSLDFTANLSGGRGGAAAGGGSVDVISPKLLEPEGTVATIAAEVVNEWKDITLGVQYEHTAAGDNHFSMTSNIFDNILEALKREALKYLKQAEAKIEAAIKERLAQYIDEKWVSKEDMETIFAAVKGDKTAVEKLKNTLDEKRAELEKKAKGAVEEKVDEAKAQAEEKAAEKINEAIENVLPGASTIVPGGVKLPGIKIPGL